jgi:hypothetical protein
MNRFWGHALSTAVLAVAAGAAFPACAHDDSTLYINGVLAPPVAAQLGSPCIYTPSPTALMLSRGTVDATLTDSYTPQFLLGSQMKSQAQPDRVRAETGRIALQGALVRVIDPADGSVWMDATVLSTGLIEPAQGAVSSYLDIGATIMDKNAIAHFDPGADAAPAKLALAYVKFFGQSLGGTSIESEEFQFPINVCHRCLVYFPTEPTAADLFSYCSGAKTLNGNITSCVLGQDQATDCQLCFGANTPVPKACQP